MSGHSHYATIKRQKGLKDAVKGKIFSKMAREIAIAAKTGGGGDPDSNYKLRMAIDTARSYNMPKDNIERAISKASSDMKNFEEITYEGFAHQGVAIMIETSTDNRNRTSQEIKNLLDKGGGNLEEPGSVSFNFEHKGLIRVKKTGDTDAQMLALIDSGAEDIEEVGDVFEVYTLPDMLSQIKTKIEENGFEIESMELTQKPKNLITVKSESDANRLLKLLDSIEESESVNKVYANLDIPDEILNKIKP